MRGTAILVVENLSRGDYDPLPAFASVHQLTFPTTILPELPIDALSWLREFRLQKFVGHFVERLGARKSVEDLSALAPQNNPIIHVPHQHLRQVENPGLLVDPCFSSTQTCFCLPVRGDIAANRGRAANPPAGVLYRRDGQRNAD